MYVYIRGSYWSHGQGSFCHVLVNTNITADSAQRVGDLDMALTLTSVTVVNSDDVITLCDNDATHAEACVLIGREPSAGRHSNLNLIGFV